ncbi:UDP-N-acetylglucosamine 4,6-dehydratase family protein [Sulfurovum sp. NBC37-1]|uniref:UDP-N-acetylglucosamine 4,6-dehydratase family protein n=1 Tax=Sulfurovum sp. (strain NBC37-1) TaxID=387093 RepID=UPI0001587843|nr:nucleoside-diphosphate sugar epimerase/dehydratase [Sulfurovum sp. NBC37-1]BAF71066.1 sugar epimerase/dehydratase [Sulfurovum sp. NBC37-1]
MILLFRPTALKRTLFFVVIDLLLSLGTLYLAYLLRFNFYIPQQFLETFWGVYLTLAVFKVAAMFWFKSYFIIWRFFSFSDAKNIIKAHILAYGMFTVFYLLFPSLFHPFPRSVIIIDFFLSLIFIGMIRMSKRFWNESFQAHAVKPTLLIGVSSKTGTIIQSAMRNEIDYYPAAIVALGKDNSSKDAYINNVKVYDFEHLGDVVNEKQITAAIITQAILQDELRMLVNDLNELGVNEIKRVKLLGSEHEKLEDLSIEDLLARHPKDLDKEGIASFIKGKSVLITGAGGSIGSEIVRQCKQFGASNLILVDNGEYNLYQIGEEIEDADLRLLDVTDAVSLRKLFELKRPEVVIHAAAYKHVPICEHNPDVAVINNVLGTKNVIDMSILIGVEKLVIISTDKAVRPTNVMGATKRVAELYAQNVMSEKTEIVAVRFGNVLGSSGSVIPKFKHQIEEGGPVTVTHPEITRYFMLIPEACQLVLQTATIAKGGELFILDMGEPIKIVDLAKQMIRLYGKEDEVEIVFTGLRDGEKLFEELLLDDSEQKTKYSSIFIAKPTRYDLDKLSQDIEDLLVSEDKTEVLQRIVPEYTRNSSI